MPHKKMTTWESIKDMLGMSETEKVLAEAAKTGIKPGKKKKYKAPMGAQNTSYLQKQIKRQERLKAKDKALKALEGK